MPKGELKLYLENRWIGLEEEEIAGGMEFGEYLLGSRNYRKFWKRGVALARI